MIRKKILLAKVSFFVVISLGAPSAYSYKLSPTSTPEERRLSGITSSYFTDVERSIVKMGLENFGEAVHEEITNRIYGCDGDESICAGPNAESAPPAVLAGVRWNDDPPFRLTFGQTKGIRCKTSETIRFEIQPMCWASLFSAAEDGAVLGKQYGPGHAMLYRTHFGDLQFLHSMATKDGELAGETKAKIMDWAEFTWRSSLGDYTLDTRLKEVPNPTIQQTFGRTEWRLLELYTLGSGNRLRTEVDDVAFGSLLHMLEDSYAEGHAEREESSGTSSCVVGNLSVTAPGAILEFHSYGNQDHAKHGEADSRQAFMRKLQERGDVVEVGKILVEARRQKLTWDQMRPMFECIFNVPRPDAKAGSGDGFEKEI